MIAHLADLLPWVVVWPFLTAVGTFIDKYYVGEGLKDRVQKKLISVFVFIDDAWKRFSGGSRAEVLPGTKTRIVQALVGLAWIVLIVWWADLRARRSSAVRTLDWAYVGPFIVGAFQGLLGGVIASMLFLVIALLLFLSLVGALYLVTRIVMDILSVASDPKHSPFAYFGSLIGLVIVAAKLTSVVLTPSAGGPAPPIQ